MIEGISDATTAVAQIARFYVEHLQIKLGHLFGKRKDGTVDKSGNTISASRKFHYTLVMREARELDKQHNTKLFTQSVTDEFERIQMKASPVKR